MRPEDATITATVEAPDHRSQTLSKGYQHQPDSYDALTGCDLTTQPDDGDWDLTGDEMDELGW